MCVYTGFVSSRQKLPGKRCLGCGGHLGVYEGLIKTHIGGFVLDQYPQVVQFVIHNMREFKEFLIELAQLATVVPIRTTGGAAVCPSRREQTAHQETPRSATLGGNGMKPRQEKKQKKLCTGGPRSEEEVPASLQWSVVAAVAQKRSVAREPTTATDLKEIPRCADLPPESSL